MAIKRKATGRRGATSRGKGPSIMEFARAGFGLTLGSLFALMIFLAIGLLFFIPGFILVKREHKKPKEEQSGTAKVIGYILMVIGMIIGLGFGAGAFLDMLSQEF
jgi:hypothetical protein